MNNSTSIICPNIEIIIGLIDATKGILVVLDIITNILNAIFNATVVISLIKTGQNQVQSLKLLLYMSASAFIAAFVDTPAIVVFVNLRNRYCSFKVNLVFIISLFYNLDFGLYNLVILDRYLHIKYLSTYTTNFTRKKFNYSLACCIVVSVMLTATYVISPNHYNKVQIMVGIILLIISTTTFLISIKKLQVHQEQNRQLSNQGNDITRYAKIYFILYTVIHIPAFVLIGILTAIDSNEYLLLKQLIRIYLKSFSYINAGTFIYSNNRCKQFIVTKFRSIIGRGNNINPIIVVAEDAL